MIEKAPASTPGQVQITFQLPSSIWAERVTLVGEFNDWSRTITPMRRDSDGRWRVTLQLASGRDYQFRYLVDDEQWVNDYDADSYVANAYGSDNSVVHASLPPAPEPAAEAAPPAPAEPEVDSPSPSSLVADSADATTTPSSSPPVPAEPASTASAPEAAAKLGRG